MIAQTATLKIMDVTALSPDQLLEERRAKRSLEMTVRKYTNFADIKADEYRYWQSRPVHERVNAVSELTTEQYAMKGVPVPRLQRTLVRIERPPR